MTSPGGEESSRHGDLSHEKITLSLPPEFFQAVSDEFEHVLELLDSQQTVLRTANEERGADDADRGKAGDDADSADTDSAGGDRLNRLVRDLVGKDIDSLQVERSETHRRSYGVAASELYQAAGMLGAQARHRLDRLAVAFDQIAGDPVRREIARRRVEEAAERKGRAKE